MPSSRQASPWLVLVLVCFAQFMVVLDATIVNVALPSIQTDLNLDAADLQWVVNSYTLLFGGFLLLGGRAADLFGRQRVFLAGIAIFSLASLANALSTSSEMLIVARGLQGLGAALVSPAALSIVTTTFAEGADRTRALGIWSAIAAGGGAVGLLLGGILTDLLTWEWIFLVNVPVGLVAFVLSLRYVPDSRAENRSSVDILGALSVTAGLIVLVYAIVKAEAWGWGSGRTLGMIGAAAVLLAAFVAIEQRVKAPLVRLSIFRNRPLAAANLVMLFAASGMFAMFFFASLYMQNILDLSPLETGLAFLPITAGIMAGAGTAQSLIRRAGVRTVALAGLAIATAGMALMTSLPVDGSYVGDLLPGLLLIAAGVGLIFVPITLIATGGLAAEDAGLASGIFNTSQQVGGALGLAILSTLAADHTASLGETSPAALVDGWQVAFQGGAVLMGAGLVLLAVLLRRRDVQHLDLSDAAVPVGV
ncbi:MAG TPA: MFS transporter [Solirubrobacteraceae bacterium]|nr:MFS transporter [Solirubrobacteraceae bacterium]